MLKIYVSHASDFLTDYLPHGEGLLSFAWLKALAERGHQIHAYSPNADVKQAIPLLKIYRSKSKLPFPSLSYWEYAHTSNNILKQLLKNEAIDIVWRMYPYQALAPRVKTFGRPLIIGPLYSSFNQENIISNTPFGFRPSKLGTFFGNKGWAKTLKMANGLFTDDQKLENDLKEKFPEKLIKHLPAIIDPPVKVNKRDIPDFNKEVRLAFIGHFHPTKRVVDFCRIVNLLRQKGYNTKGIIVGQGEEEQKALNYSKENQLENHIEFLGTKPNNEIFYILLKAHLLLNLRKETYGRNIIEAMSVGTPNICVNELAASEFLEQGKTGILLDDTSVESYVKNIEEVLLLPHKWELLSNNSLLKSSKWSSERIAILLENQFHSVLKKTFL